MTADIIRLAGAGSQPRAGTAEARNMVDFDEMVASRGTTFLRFAMMLCGDLHLAEDLVQTVLARAYAQWAKVEAADHPEAYLKAMIVNEHLSWRRRRSSRELPIARSAADRGEAVADGASSRAEREAVWALLARLPRRQRAVLVLRYYEDLTDAQIADILGCSASTVRSNAARALAALRTVIPTLDGEVLR